MPTTTRRLDAIAPSVFQTTTQLANQYQAVNLSQGFPDFNPPEALCEALARVAHGPHHQYAMTYGAPRFREALAAKISRHSQTPIDPNEHLVVTCGSTEAMMVAIMAITNPGDQVIIFSPYYENYYADTILSGATAIWVPLRAPTFTFDPDEVERAFARGAKALILCNPSNPTGKVFTRAELDVLLALAIKYDAYLIVDEPYEHFVYAPHTHTYVHALPGAFERTLVVNSLSKTYAITGWRLGYVQGPAPVMKLARKVHDFLTVGAATPLQEAAVTALELPDTYYEELRTFYTRQRALLLGYLDRMGLPYIEPHGAYYVLVNISSLGFASDFEASDWFIKTVGVAGIAGSTFFHEPVHDYLRFHFAKSDATLHAAGERLVRLQEHARQLPHAR